MAYHPTLTRWLALTVAGFLPSLPFASHAQAPAAEEEVTLKVELRDGTVLIGVPMTDSFPVATDYGDVTITTRQLQSIRPGLRVSAERQAEIAAALEKLNPEDFVKRDKAIEEIKAFGDDAVPTLQAFLAREGLDEDLAAIVAQLLKDLDPRRKVVAHDAVEAEGLSCHGALQIDELVMTSSLGELTISMDLISEIRFQRQMMNLGEDFESLDLKDSDWTATANNATVWQVVERQGSSVLWAGAAGSNKYTDGAVATVTSPEYNIGSMSSPKFSARVWVEVEDGCDAMTMQFTGDGSNWVNVESFGNATRQWQNITKDLANFRDAGMFQFRLVFTSDGSGTYSGVYFDDFEITDSD